MMSRAGMKDEGMASLELVFWQSPVNKAPLESSNHSTVAPCILEPSSFLGMLSYDAVIPERMTFHNSKLTV